MRATYSAYSILLHLITVTMVDRTNYEIPYYAVFPTFRHFLPLRSKSLEHPVLIHPQSVRYLWEISRFTFLLWEYYRAAFIITILLI